VTTAKRPSFVEGMAEDVALICSFCKSEYFCWKLEYFARRA
jgi:hypothetical protein